MPNVTKGQLIEYVDGNERMSLAFEFNPQNISRTRSIEIRTGSTPATRGGYDFSSPTETPRVAQGVSVKAETFDITILLDATDRMNKGDSVAISSGVEPEIAILRTLVEVKTQGPTGEQSLSSLGYGGMRAFNRNEYPSVLLFVWGRHVLPVFISSVKIDEKAHLPTLVPYRAEATLGMQVIEGNNPIYKDEIIRQVEMASQGNNQSSGVTSGSLY